LALLLLFDDLSVTFCFFSLDFRPPFLPLSSSSSDEESDKIGFGRLTVFDFDDVTASSGFLAFVLEPFAFGAKKLRMS
jgi:hypothetical protein